MSCQSFEDLLAAYPLDALEPADRARLEAHLEHCPDCTAELTSLQRVAAQLALTLPQHDPPPALRDRILTAARQDGASDPDHEQAGPPTESRSTYPPFPAREGGGGVRSVQGVRPSRPKLTTLALLAAAVVALLWAASLQLQLIATQRQLAETTAQLERFRGNYNAVIGVLASPALVVRDLRPAQAAPGASSTVWIDHRSGEGMMMARDLPPLGENQAYQVWLNNGQGRVSCGFLRPYEGGFYYLILDPPGRLTDYQQLGVTREPLGGSPAPTGPRVVEGDL